VQVDPQHLSVLSGVGAVLDLLFQCIAEPGDGVLIPAPYYPAFDNDLRVSGQPLVKLLVKHGATVSQTAVGAAVI
jgi:1-aminocyclopropane-1-carboxylate synthase